MSAENEIVAEIYSVLTGDDTLMNDSGIDPETGLAREIQVYGQPTESAQLPYVRITLTDALPLDEEGFQITTPVAGIIGLLVNVFSDWEPEVRSIAARLRYLLGEHAVSTTGFKGWTRLESTDYYDDNLSDPDHVIRSAALRVRCILEPA